MTINRQLWVVVHRWAGLTIALFLIVAGTTGAVLPWQESLTFASRPSASRVAPPAPGAMPLDGITLAERVERRTGGRVSFIPLDVPRDHVARIDVESRAGRPPLPYDTVWANPYTGQVRLAFRNGVLADGAQNIVPFVYELHYSLALGAWGVWAFGVAALIWTIDCFVGLYLTFPIGRRFPMAASTRGRSWLARWRPAWTVRTGARGHKLNVDLHLAGGLWLWPLLFVFAWSSVGLNLPAVHRPVMTALGASRDVDLPTLAAPLDTPPLDLRAAHRVGRTVMAAEGRRRGFTVEREGYLYYQPASGLYGYAVRTSADPTHDDTRTRIYLDARDGHLVRFEGPLGENATDATMSWFYMLHFAQVFGVPYRIFVSLLGVGIVVLSVTGILIWMKKRAARILRRRRAPSRRGAGFAMPVAAE